MSYLSEAGLLNAAAALLLLLAALGAGHLLWRRQPLRLQTLLEQCALGLGVFGLAALALAQARLFVPWLLIVVPLFAVVGLFALHKHRTALSALLPQTNFEKIVVAVVALCLGAGLLAALGPELEPDALAYHLPAAQAIAQNSDAFDAHNYPTGYPLLVEALYAWLALPDLAEAARVLHWLTTILAVLATALLGRRIADRQTGALAAALLAGTPLIVWTSQTANTDAFGILFFTLAVLRLDDHFREGRSGDLLIAALFAGLCASVKIWNLMFVPLFAAAVFAFWLRMAKQKKASVVKALIAATTFALTAGVVYLPWALRALAHTGNPVYPMLASMFTPGEQADFFAYIATHVREGYGLGHGFVDLLLIGWRLTFQPEHFGHLAIGWLLLPLITFGLARLRRWPLLGLLTPIAGVAFLLWFATSQQVRYLAPLFAYAAVLAAAPVTLAARQSRFRFLPALIALLALSGWAPLVAAQWPQAGFVPRVHADLLVGKATRDQIREQYAYNDEWSLWRFINTTSSTNETILGDGAQARWWARRNFVDLSYDPASYVPAIRDTLQNKRPLDHPASLIVTNVANEPRWRNAGDFCLVYTNGLLVVLQRLPEGQTCEHRPLSMDEPYRWLTVAGPRDPGGWWWIGERAELLLPGPVAALELLSPFAEKGISELSVQVGDNEPFVVTVQPANAVRVETDGATIVTLRAHKTADPAAMGFAGDPAPKSFLVKIGE